MKKKGLVYNVSKIPETLDGKNIKLDSFKDGEQRANGKHFECLLHAIDWISQNMYAHGAKEVQININLK